MLIVMNVSILLVPVAQSACTD
jgi:hypothetical protein